MNARTMFRFFAGLVAMTCTVLLLIADSAECPGYTMTLKGIGSCGAETTLTLAQNISNHCGIGITSSDPSVMPSGTSTFGTDPRSGGWSYEGFYSAGSGEAGRMIRRCETTRVGDALHFECFNRPQECTRHDAGTSVVPDDGGVGGAGQNTDIDECTETPTCKMDFAGQ